MVYKCEWCGKEFDKPVTSGHKRKCPQFNAANPDRRPPACLCGYQCDSLTQMKRHRKGCVVWRERDAESTRLSRQIQTFEKKYGEGVTNAVNVPGAAQKKAITMVAKYGVDNLFRKGSPMYEQIQSHWDGKSRTEHLPKDNFSRPEIKEKIRQYWRSNYGVDNCTQVPEIRAKQLSTNLSRYGDEHILRIPDFRKRFEEIHIQKRGVTDPAKDPDVLEKISKTNMERYGVPWATMSDEIREKMNESQIRNYGSMFFASEAGRRMVELTTEQRQEAYRQTCLERYGAPHPMQNAEWARKHLEHERRAGPNSIEAHFMSICPEFMFTGDGSFWRYIPKLDTNKNPDFVLPGVVSPGVSDLFGGVTHIVEIFGTYWHSEAITGKSSIDHEIEIIDAWNDVGLNCLVVWEAEFSNPDNIRKRVLDWMPHRENTDFDIHDIICDRCDAKQAAKFLIRYHYARYGRPATVIYSATLNGDIIAVIKFAPPVRQTISKSLDIDNSELLELDRFCIHPSYHKKNFASYLMSIAIKRISVEFPHIKKLVSYADPVAGHIGTIYKASNWKEIGKTSYSYVYIDNNENEINKKSVYESAKKSGMSEGEYVRLMGYRRVHTPPKIKFVYDLR